MQSNLSFYFTCSVQLKFYRSNYLLSILLLWQKKKMTKLYNEVAIQLASFPGPCLALSLGIQLAGPRRVNRQCVSCSSDHTLNTWCVWQSPPTSQVRYVSSPVSLLFVFSWPSFTYAHFDCLEWEKIPDPLSCYFVLQATESWAGPGNKTIVHCIT